MSQPHFVSPFSSNHSQQPSFNGQQVAPVQQFNSPSVIRQTSAEFSSGQRFSSNNSNGTPTKQVIDEVTRVGMAITENVIDILLPHLHANGAGHITKGNLLSIFNIPVRNSPTAVPSASGLPSPSSTQRGNDKCIYIIKGIPTNPNYGKQCDGTKVPGWDHCKGCLKKAGVITLYQNMGRTVPDDLRKKAKGASTGGTIQQPNTTPFGAPLGARSAPPFSNGVPQPHFQGHQQPNFTQGQQNHVQGNTFQSPFSRPPSQQPSFVKPSTVADPNSMNSFKPQQQQQPQPQPQAQEEYEEEELQDAGIESLPNVFYDPPSGKVLRQVDEDKFVLIGSWSNGKFSSQVPDKLVKWASERDIQVAPETALDSLPDASVSSEQENALV